MKRSEMVQKLMDFMENTPPPDDDTESVSMLIKALEDFGMKPPTTIVHPSSYNRAEGQMGFEVNEWEPESLSPRENN